MYVDFIPITLAIVYFISSEKNTQLNISQVQSANSTIFEETISIPPISNVIFTLYGTDSVIAIAHPWKMNIIFQTTLGYVSSQKSKYVKFAF